MHIYIYIYINVNTNTRNSMQCQQPTMAGSDPQRELLSLFRNVASQKSQGERRIVTLKMKIEKLNSALSEANVELEDIKRSKELVEQELKGYEVQLFMSEASVQTLQARVSLIQDEISSVGRDLDDLKNEEAALREEFLTRMFELNNKIRKFHESVSCYIDAVDSASYEDAEQQIMKENAEDSLSTIENMLADIISRTTKEEEEYEAEKDFHKKVQQELIDWERKVSLMHMIIKETKALQDLTISELEATYQSFCQEFQRRCVCPSCHLNNLEAVGHLLWANGSN